MFSSGGVRAEVKKISSDDEIDEIASRGGRIQLSRSRGMRSGLRMGGSMSAGASELV